MLRSTLLSMALCLMAGCIMVVPVPLGTLPGAGGTGPSPTSAPTNAAFHSGLGDFRASQGRGALQYSPLLAQAASAHAADMVQRGYFSHESPGGPNGANLAARIRATGCRLSAAAENIAQGQKTEPAVLAAWAGSPGHRRNMLRADFTEYGLGRVGDTWVLVLGAGC